MNWDDIWSATSEVAAETWDLALGVGQAVVAEKVQNAKEAGKDPEILRVTEPVKGKNSDGSTIVAQPQPTNAQPQLSGQFVDGVENGTLLAGGFLTLVAVVVLVKVL